MNHLRCLLGFHKMRIVNVVDKGNGAFTMQKYKIVQCVRCKEYFE